MEGNRFVLSSFLFVLALSLHGAQGQGTFLRLVDSSGNVQNSFGRVEVNFNGTWGTVCDDEWDDLDAAVICKMLGYPNGGRAFGNAFFGPGTGPILLDNVKCDGSETNITDCVKNNIGQTDCQHNEDAGVNCTVTGGGTVTPPTTTTTPAPVVPPSNCTGPPDPNLQLRASADAPRGMGIVEVRNSSGQWGTICDDDFDVKDAAVVCRALCFATNNPRPGALARYIRGGSTYGVAVDNINCTGTETSLDACPRSPWGVHDCAPTEKASVTCLHLDSAPRDAPVPRLDCREGYLVAAFNKSYDPNLEPKFLSVADQPGCREASTNNDTQFVTISIPFTACGTTISQNETHLFYSNTIKYDHTSYEGAITRVNTFRIAVTCEMSRENRLTREEVPLTAAATQRAPGEFVITMKFYRNDSFSVEDTQTPLRLPIGEWLNVGLQMENVDSKLKLIVPTCRAYPYNNDTSVQYTLFQNNCREEPSLATFPFNQTRFGFRYQTFMFVNSPSVYIACDTFVCQATDNTAVCDRSCNSSKPQPATPSPSPSTSTTITRRRRRDVSDFTPRHYSVTSPPVIVYRMDNTETVIERIAGDGSVLGTTIRPAVTEVPSSTTASPSTSTSSTSTSTSSTSTSTSTPSTPSDPRGPVATSSPAPHPRTSSAPPREPTGAAGGSSSSSSSGSGSSSSSSSSSGSGSGSSSSSTTTSLRWEWAQGITAAPTTREATPSTPRATTPAGPAILRDSQSLAAEILRRPAQSQSQSQQQRGQHQGAVLVPVRAASSRTFCSFAVISLAVVLAVVLC